MFKIDGGSQNPLFQSRIKTKQTPAVPQWNRNISIYTLKKNKKIWSEVQNLNIDIGCADPPTHHNYHPPGGSFTTFPIPFPIFPHSWRGPVTSQVPFPKVQWNPWSPGRFRREFSGGQKIHPEKNTTSSGSLGFELGKKTHMGWWFIWVS